MNQSERNTMRIAVIGDSGVGKTSWIQRLTKPDSDINTVSETVGCIHTDFVMHTCRGSFPIVLLDYAGDWFSIERENGLKTVDGVIIIVDLSDAASFLRLWEWEQEIKGLSVPVVLVWAKKDLPRKIGIKKLQKYCRNTVGRIYDGIYSISAKIAAGINRPILHLIRHRLINA